MLKFLFEIFLIFSLAVSLNCIQKKREAINNLAYQGYSPYSSGFDGYCRNNINCVRGLICNIAEYKCKCPNGQQL